MTTNKELIEFLKQYPDDARIQFLQTRAVGYDTCIDFLDLDIKSGVNVIDYRSHPEFKDLGVIIELGEEL